MKTVLFFYREELTYLFLSISKAIERSNNKVIHVAYSSKEKEILEQRGGYHDIIVFKESIKTFYSSCNIDDFILAEIDNLFHSQTGGRFNLNGSIQSDRGFEHLSYQETLKISVAYYHFWKNIFEKNSIDIVLHEMPSLMMNHMCSVVSKLYNAKYLYFIPTKGESNFSYLQLTGDDYCSLEIEKKTEYFEAHPSEIDIERCDNFLSSFRSDFKIFMSNASSTHSFVQLVFLSLKEQLRYLLRKNSLNRLFDNVEFWILKEGHYTKRLKNKFKYLNIHTENKLPKNEPFFYYPFHYEPEATVLYAGDGIYENQTKLIQNIAASLPPGVYLYVKDHPHEKSYRDVIDYRRLSKIPNIRLLAPEISGKLVIKNAIGVFTINGTAGFEALLLNKLVFTFGHVYYNNCKKVCQIQNVRDLRNVVSNACKMVNDENSLYPFLYAYLTSQQTGVIDFFGGRSAKYQFDEKQNAETISSSLIHFANNY